MAPERYHQSKLLQEKLVPAPTMPKEPILNPKELQMAPKNQTLKADRQQANDLLS
jgi:hypothetical protein